MNAPTVPSAASAASAERPEAVDDMTTAEFPASAVFLEWTPVEEGLPPLDTPVWLYLPAIGQPLIGERSDDGDGWLWAREYGSPWYDKALRRWRGNNSEQDDITPSHWMHLPQPPTHGLSSRNPVSVYAENALTLKAALPRTRDEGRLGEGEALRAIHKAALECLNGGDPWDSALEAVETMGQLAERALAGTAKEEGK